MLGTRIVNPMETVMETPHFPNNEVLIFQLHEVVGQVSKVPLEPLEGARDAWSGLATFWIYHLLGARKKLNKSTITYQRIVDVDMDD